VTNKQTTLLSQQKKRIYARSKIDEAANSNKALYSTLKMLTGQKESPVYPDADCDTTVANQFVETFTKKVRNIRSHLEQNPSCTSIDYIPKLIQIILLRSVEGWIHSCLRRSGGIGEWVHLFML